MKHKSYTSFLTSFFVFILFFTSIGLCAQTEVDELSIDDEPFYTSLSKASRNAEKVYKLDLRNKGLTEFPPEILKLKELRVLILDSNQITTVPAHINELQHLIYFSLSHNAIRDISPDIGSLGNLKYLYLNFNNLSVLPQSFYLLDDLRELFINNNNLKELPADVKSLKKLERLVASNNQFETVPDEIGHLYSLRRLSLSKNHIKELPEHFYELTNLTELFLGDNNLKKIDGRIKKLSKLEVLTLDNNKLAGLPPEFGELYSLTGLYVDYNEITAFPSEIGNLFKLKKLYMGNNACREIPYNFNNLIQLETLDITDLSFQSFPQVLYDMQNNGTKITGMKTKELYQAKLLLSQARNKKLTGNVSEAINLYTKLIGIDTNNAAAMSEYALILLDSSKFDEAATICKRALSKNASPKVLDDLRATYSNSLNKTNTYDQVINNYTLKIKADSLHAAPYYELGKFYFDQKKYNDAKLVFRQAVEAEPTHSNSHFYLAIISLIKNEKEEFIFPALRLFMLAPTSNKTKTTFPFVLTKMNMKTGVAKKNGSTSYYDSYIIRNDANEIIYKSENPTSDLLLAMFMDLAKNDLKKDKKIRKDEDLKKAIDAAFNVEKNNIDIFQSELPKICADYAANKSNVWEYYAAYYAALIENHHLEAFAYTILNIRNPNDETNLTWIKNNPDKINSFNTWNKNYKWISK